MIRTVYVIDATTMTANFGFTDTDALRGKVIEFLDTAPKGSAVRLLVGKTYAPWPASMTDDGVFKPEDHWARLVNQHQVQIEGDAYSVQAWEQSLNQCLIGYKTRRSAA